ncbi:MAG: toll/interleukin-1 receptor domain-containing protein [Candidatus Thiodiazotropha sp.]
MEQSSIFLSYRRRDSSGYIGRVADHLESAFGETVFLDVDSIKPGSDWKKVLNEAVSRAQIVLAIIGDDWQQALTTHSPDETDFIRFELNLARILDKLCIPVIFQGSKFDYDSDLGNLNWIKDLQFFELSDKQGRWEQDMTTLAEQIADMSGLIPMNSITETKTGNSVNQYSKGDQSPNINTKEGSVTITFEK